MRTFVVFTLLTFIFGGTLAQPPEKVQPPLAQRTGDLSVATWNLEWFYPFPPVEICVYGAPKGRDSSRNRFRRTFHRPESGTPRRIAQSTSPPVWVS